MNRLRWTATRVVQDVSGGAHRWQSSASSDPRVIHRVGCRNMFRSRKDTVLYPFPSGDTNLVRHHCGEKGDP